MKCLAFSTRLSPEVCGYLDPGKFGVMVQAGIDDNGAPTVFRHIGRVDDAHDYWEGE